MSNRFLAMELMTTYRPLISYRCTKTAREQALLTRESMEHLAWKEGRVAAHLKGTLFADRKFRPLDIPGRTEDESLPEILQSHC